MGSSPSRRETKPDPFGGAVPYEDVRLGRQYVEGAYIYPLGQARVAGSA
ncbi:hypothetical protein FTUN_3569 [Frigoriglobus tundricola]|uniref:Uncharacterized protein n=1 Tax=Frigoriglobus tundricola TaxID=2774151 RepID=A0A6M5YPV1_9BACT|nr:hypothetical protein FTUN_3569 [Frigoriglobus tundricola]